jgi:uncharacterized protein (TIGR01777 family)
MNLLWDPAKSPPPAESLACDAFVHLAGAPVAQRWSAKVKEQIRSSRVDGTQRLIDGLAASSQRPSVLVCASAVGYYGDRGSEEITESSSAATDFLGEVCVEWEKTARKAEALGIRVVLMRTGIVLGNNGGALAKMLPPFRAGVGGRIGSGEQWMPWIHIDDHVRLTQFAIENKGVSGPVNATSPNPVTNAAFTSALARVLRRPAFIPVPAFALRFLFGEMAQILTGGQRALPLAAQSAGFVFQYPELTPALKNILG